MPSLTLKNVPSPLLRALRASATADRRSLNQQAMVLLSRALGLERDRISTEQVDAQVEAWRRLAGSWRSDLDPRDEAKLLRKARTRGRKVDL
jgi:plasmid stability protein